MNPQAGHRKGEGLGVTEKNMLHKKDKKEAYTSSRIVDWSQEMWSKDSASSIMVSVAETPHPPRSQRWHQCH